MRPVSSSFNGHPHCTVQCTQTRDCYYMVLPQTFLYLTSTMQSFKSYKLHWFCWYWFWCGSFVPWSTPVCGVFFFQGERVQIITYVNKQTRKYYSSLSVPRYCCWTVDSKGLNMPTASMICWKVSPRLVPFQNVIKIVKIKMIFLSVFHQFYNSHTV